MNMNEVKKYMKGNRSKLMKTLEMDNSNFNHWEKNGYIPLNVQIRLELLTDGDLKADLPFKRGCLKQWHLNH